MRSATTSTIEDQTKTLAHDFEEVVTDAQELLETMGTEGGAKLTEMKRRVQASIEAARKQLGELQVSVTDGAKAVASTTDEYVHENPWGAIGIGAAVGVLVGYLLARRSA
ncbi:MAG TPA: DUF883 family protein [Usitatibacter sp.]|jgi:ElaB/YqjD/DUF883 family membrane-anchored ribosome-binding protein|nr:DUF883 family protein [Usitatibacter sp.]